MSETREQDVEARLADAEDALRVLLLYVSELDPSLFRRGQLRDMARAYVEAKHLRDHVCAGAAEEGERDA